MFLKGVYNILHVYFNSYIKVLLYALLFTLSYLSKFSVSIPVSDWK